MTQSPLDAVPLGEMASFETQHTALEMRHPLPIRLDLEGFEDVYALHRLFARHLPREAVLDFCEIGCAPGHWLIYFHQYFHYRVHGFDLSQNGAALTRANLESAAVPGEVLCADAFDIPFGEGRFDFIFSHSFLEHFENPLAVFEIHHRLVKPGGLIYIGVPNMRYLNRVMLSLADRLLGKHRPLRRISNEKSADPSLFRDAAKKFDWDLLFLGYAGFFQPSMFAGLETKEPGKGSRKIGRFVGRELPASRLYSPTLCMIARKK